MYCLSLVSLFILRNKEPNLERPYKVYYRLVPGLALALGLLSLFCVIYYSVLSGSLPLFGIDIPLIVVILLVYGVAIPYYFFYAKKNLKPIEEEFGVLDVLEENE
jgi:ethanolamine permease